MLTVRVHHNFDQVLRAITADAKQANFAAAVAMNKAAQWAETDVRRAMRSNFDRPTPWFLKSLRLLYASANRKPLQAQLVFKDTWKKGGSSETFGESLVLPHVEGGLRKHKPMEVRLQRAGLMPRGWYAVPGSGADLDAFGNMSRGQVSQLLGVLGTFQESGFNRADARTVERLRKGNAKKGVYGFEYWVNPADGRRAKHLQPGVYKRIQTAFGTSLKPVLIFVSRTTYRKRFDFYGIAQRTFDTRFPGEFDTAFDNAMRTAR